MTSNTAAPILLWFRQDLRLADNTALVAAAESGRPIIPVFIFDDASAGRWKPGGASRWWLHGSLAALADAFAHRSGRPQDGSALVLRSGAAIDVISRLVDETGARSVFWNRCYEPATIARDRMIEESLRRSGIEARSFNAALLFEPWQGLTRQGSPYRRFTPFYRACRVRPIAPTHPVPTRIALPPTLPASEPLESLRLLPNPDWAGGLRAAWQPGEAGAHARLAAFLDGAPTGYGDHRDRPDLVGTSRLSPHLHFGEIGPRQVWHAVMARSAALQNEAGTEAFLRQLIWREFSYHLLYHFPDLPERPLRPEFARFPWRTSASDLAAWRRGESGYPIVDAGMRELWATGWMHNRVRLIAASFLIKDLMISWEEGEAWFWDTLVDADLANNAANWQWIAGCGIDAAPYFRVFNPVLQSRRFDPQGTYIARWIPELARLPARFRHAPWEAPAAALGDAGISPGHDYPRPIVDHDAARARVLEAYRGLRTGHAPARP